jgi:hypothetical protein
MATHDELLHTLTGASYTFGWAGVAAFDGALIATALADYYAPLLSDMRTLAAVSAQRIDFDAETENYGTLTNVELAAPRISFRGADLQDSRMRVSFELLRGTYSERRRAPGEAEVIERLVNLGQGRRYQFVVDVHLSRSTADITQGTVYLSIGQGSHPLCDVGSSPLAQEMIGQYLLDILNAGHTQQLVLPLGTLLSERGHVLPTGFVLRTQAKPDGTDEEGALVAFIRGPDGARGTIPGNESLPYLIPDGLDADFKPYSATLLIDRHHAKRMRGEDPKLFGNLLFPNEQYFQTSSTHQDTRDMVVFGRLEVPRTVREMPMGQRNAPGVTAQLVTRHVGANARPVSIQTASLEARGWTWELRIEGLGMLVPQGGCAIYTPPAELPSGTSVQLQRIIARNTLTGAHREVCCVLQSGANIVEFKNLLVDDINPGGTRSMEHGYQPEDDETQSWSVLGQGTLSGDIYTAPSVITDDIEVVVYRSTFERGGKPVLAAYGYCIVALKAATAVPTPWTTLQTFTIKPAHANAQPYANGLQQFAIDVEVETAAGQTPISDEELATLRLVFNAGVDVDKVPRTLEGLFPDAQGSVTDWGVKLHRNAFVLAGAAPGVTGVDTVPPVVRNSRTKRFYLHTTSETPASLVARLTDRDGVIHTSNIPGGSEADFRVLRVIPKPVPRWSEQQYVMMPTRVRGNHLSDPTDTFHTKENPDFDWNLYTTDYWRFYHRVDGLHVAFVRLQWAEDGPGVKWESEQNAEDMFSYLGYALIRPGAPVPEFLEFASELYNPVLHNSNPPFEGRPPYAAVHRDEVGNAGGLLLALIRVSEIFYRQKKLIPGFDLERPFLATLWDEHGNRHPIEFGFSDRDHVVYRTT